MRCTKPVNKKKQRIHGKIAVDSIDPRVCNMVGAARRKVRLARRMVFARRPKMSVARVEHTMNNMYH